MATVKRFEELQVWREAERQCRAFYALVKERRFLKEEPLKDQMDRSSASVMDNIAEGFDRYTKADFRHFLVIARGSNAEFRSQLFRAKARGVIDEQQFEQLKTSSEHLGVKLHNFINYLSTTTYKKKPDQTDWYSKSEALQEPLHDYNSLPEEAPFPEYTVALPEELVAATSAP